MSASRALVGALVCAAVAVLTTAGIGLARGEAIDWIDALIIAFGAVIGWAIVVRLYTRGAERRS